MNHVPQRGTIKTSLKSQKSYLCHMSLQSLYTIKNLQISDADLEAQITFDASHEIFNGHFPGQPIVPGVCLVHIVKELASIIAEEEVLLTKGSNIKFLNIIDPQQNPEVSMKGSFTKNEDGGLTLTTNIVSGDVVFFKFKGGFSHETLKH